MKLSQIITTFFLSLTCLTTYAQKGTWSGKIIIQGMELPLVFNFNDNNCTLDSPSQGINNIPAEKSVDEDGTIKVFIILYLVVLKLLLLPMKGFATHHIIQHL